MLLFLFILLWVCLNTLKFLSRFIYFVCISATLEPMSVSHAHSGTGVLGRCEHRLVGARITPGTSAETATALHHCSHFSSHLCGRFCLHVCLCTPVCLVPGEAGRRHWIPWNWSYKWLFAMMWVLGTKSRFSGRTANAEPSSHPSVIVS